MKSSEKSGMVAVALLDISSASIAGAHALVKASGNTTKDTAVILNQSRSDVGMQTTLDISRYLDEATRLLEGVIADMRATDTHHPVHIEVVLGSPWYTSQTRTITYKKNTPFVCTEHMVDQLIEKEIAYMLKSEEDEFGTVGSEQVIVEKQISLIKLNGYATNTPYGKKAESLELYLSVTIVPRIVAERFKNAIMRSYGNRPIHITTAPYATFVVARDHLHLQHEAVIVDVGEEVTDVAFVKDSLFLYQHSFPIGTYGLYRALESVAGHKPHESKAVIESYRLGKAGTSSPRIEKAIMQFTESWQKGFQEVLDDGRYGFCLPSQCFVTSEIRFEMLFHDAIKNDPFVQHMCARGIVNPIVISSETLASLIVIPTDIELDVPLATAALFAEKLLKG